MNISKIVLFNFDGVDGVAAFNFSDGLNRFTGQNAIINGIRFVLDRTYTYENNSRKSPQYVQVVIKSLEQDLCLTLTRTVQRPDQIDIDGKSVPIKTFYKDLAKVIVCFDGEFVEATKQLTAKSFLSFLSNPNQIQSRLTKSVKENFISELRETRLEVEELRDVVNRSVDFYNQIQERNNRIKHCQIIQKCYQRKVHESFVHAAGETANVVKALSRNCNELNSGLHDLVMDMINEKKVINASLEIPMTEFYFLDRQFPSSFDGIYDCLVKDYKHVSTLMAGIISQQRKDLLDVLKVENVSSKLFQLELLIELSEMPANNLDSLNAERVRLNQMYSCCYKEAQVEQNVIEKDLAKGGDFVRKFNETIKYLLEDELREGLADFERTCISTRESIEKANLNKVTEINFKSQLSEIKQVLDYEDSILDGLSSLLQLLHSDKYTDIEGQFLGPIFQLVDFTEDVDVAMKTYFRSQLKHWYPVVVVKTVAYAQKIMLDFNRLQLKGTITVISCDNYRQKTSGGGTKTGVPLTEVIVDGDRHPLRNLFSTIIYNEEMDLLTEDGQCIEDPLTGGLTLQCNDFQVVNVQLENVLKSFYDTQIELIQLERETVGIATLQADMEQGWNQIVDKVYEICASIQNFMGFREQQKELRFKIEAFSKSKEAVLNKIDFKQKINQKLIEMVSSGEVNADKKYYQQQIVELLKAEDSGRESRMGVKYDPRKVENLLEELSFSHLQDNSLLVIVRPPELILKTPCYAHIEVPFRPSIPQLLHETHQYKVELRNAFRLFLKYKRMEQMVKVQTTVLEEILASSTQNMNLRGNNGKTVEELASELHQLNVECNVNPASRLYSKNAISRVKQILKNYSEIIEKETDLKACEESLPTILLYTAPNTEFNRISTLWSYIQFFYETCRTHPITKVELICKANPTHMKKGVSAQLAMQDLCGADVAFATPFGIFRVEDLGPSNFQVFCIALAFANMKYNQIKVITIKEFDQIDADLLVEILSFLEANDVQVILETKDRPTTSFLAMESFAN